VLMVVQVPFTILILIFTESYPSEQIFIKGILCLCPRLALIIILHPSARPPTIIRTIWAIWVDAIKSHALWSLAHVTTEVLKPIILR
jgi:hypothetical protein